MDKALTVFIWAWIATALAVNLTAVVGFFIAADSFWDGWQKVAEIYSPFNVINMLMEVLLVSPAIAAAVWRDRRRARKMGTA